MEYKDMNIEPTVIYFLGSPLFYFFKKQMGYLQMPNARQGSNDCIPCSPK